MEYRQLGTSDVRVCPLTLGTWVMGGWLWGGVDESVAMEAIRASVDAGITSIDTAPVYGFGQSEELIGKVLRDLPRDSVQILTKFGLRWDGTPGYLHYEKTVDQNGTERTIRRCAKKDSVIEECEQSLRRLQTGYIDLYQLHWPDPEIPIAETMEALALLQQQGKIRAGGVSNFTAAQLEQARGWGALASNQVPYSMLRRDIESELLPYCREHCVGVLAYSPLQRGLLTGKITPATSFSPGDNRADHPFFSRENRSRVAAFLSEIQPIAKRHDVTLAQLVLAWTMQIPGITSVLVGARTPAQARENARAAALRLSEEDVQALTVLIDRHGLKAL